MGVAITLVMSRAMGRVAMLAGDIGVLRLKPMRQSLVDQFLQGAIDGRRREPAMFAHGVDDVIGRQGLFRAGELLVPPDRATVEIGLTRTSAVAPRGTVLCIEVCDALTDAVLASAESILMFEIDPWDSEPS